MTEQERQLKLEIERDEAWLADKMQQCPAPATSLEHLKLQVRIAAQEQDLWLGGTTPPSADAMDRIKQAVHAQLASEQMTGPRVAADAESAARSATWSATRTAARSQVRFGRLRLFVPLAAAAALAMVVIPLSRFSSRPTSTGGPGFVSQGPGETGPGETGPAEIVDEVAQVWDDFVETLAETDTFSDVRVLVAGRDVDDLEQELQAVMDGSDEVWTEQEIDSLEDDIERLLAQTDTLFDV